MYSNAKKGLYKVINKNKVIKPLDQQMESFIIENDEIFLKYKSSLELKAIKYADFNKHVVKFALEPFAIQYIKPTDGKPHRYYVDMFLEFTSGDKFIVEIKSKGETQLPKPPTKPNEKSIRRYQEALTTYTINQAKWAAATEFAKSNKIRFIILTEDELHPKIPKVK